MSSLMVTIFIVRPERGELINSLLRAGSIPSGQDLFMTQVSRNCLDALSESRFLLLVYFISEFKASRFVLLWPTHNSRE